MIRKQGIAKVVNLLVTFLFIGGMALLSFTPASASGSCAATHTVSSGQSLYSISLIYGVKWTDIAAANGIGYPYTIYAGNKLCIPKGGTGGASGGSGDISVGVTSVVKDKSVAFKAYNLPKKENFTVLMGTCSNNGKGGTNVGSIKTNGVAGNYSLTVKIPSGLKGKSCLAVRITSTKSSLMSYATFTNGTTGTGGPVSPSVNTSPTITITKVIKNSAVKVVFGGMVGGYKYKIYLGGQAADGTGGRLVDTFVPPSSASVSEKYYFHDSLKGAEKITIRIECITNDKAAYEVFTNANLPS